MKSLFLNPPITYFSKSPSSSCTNISSAINFGAPAFNFSVSSHPIRRPIGSQKLNTVVRSQSLSNPQINGQEEDPDAQVQDLVVPQQWLTPSKASQESEWLRVTLHKWLDDEYCPEDTNVEISKVAAQALYKCLIEKQTDLGEILLRMAMELESISYQESFHGAFSAANAAVNLIAQRIAEA